MDFFLERMYRKLFWKDFLHTQYKLHAKLVEFYYFFFKVGVDLNNSFKFQIGQVQSVLKTHTET